MNRRKSHKWRNLLLATIGTIIVATGVFFGVQFATKTGVFRVPGVVYYGENLFEEEKIMLQNIFTDDVTLDHDVAIDVRQELKLPELKANEFLINVAVPITDFYSSKTDIVAERADELFRNCSECDFRMIDISELDFSKKLLSINGNYFLDEFDSGAVFRIMSFDSVDYAKEILPLIDGKIKTVELTKQNVLTFAQTGVTALSRGMNRKMNEVDSGAYFAEKIGGFLSQFDLTHTSNESSFSEYANERNICSDSRFIDTLTGIGLDIVELTGNHNQDCGDEAAIATVDIYEQNNIKTVGGGKDKDAASVPLNIDEKGTRITMLAYNLSTGGATYDNTPGANQYYEEVAAAQISEAKARGDFVIVDIQYYECSEYATTEEYTYCDAADSAAGNQIGLFRHLIDLGADIVVGTSAHQPQTYELYGDGEIYYGLGNLFFDQVWWPGTTRSLILVHYFVNNRLLQTKIVPTVYDESMQTTLLDNPAWFIERLVNARP